MGKRFAFLFFLILIIGTEIAYSQICATPGFDGSSPVGGQVNTYYPPVANTTLSANATSIGLAAVPPDVSPNTYKPIVNGIQEYIKSGDLLLIIQMQDATINSSNSNLYGAGITNSGPDGFGGTGYTSLGNTGLFEYVVATNDVPLTGGTLTFRGAGVGGGVVNTYYNIDFDPNIGTNSIRGQRTFQVVRVPQYSNVQLTANIAAPPFNGKVGGIIAFDVAGTMDFNGKTIDASARGFRGGFVYTHASPDGCNSSDYVALSDNTDFKTSGKGEGIAGSSLNMWDGFFQVTNTLEGLPAGSFGRGAAGNAGGGGNIHNSGGGGGGNGGFGGLGGAACCSFCTVNSTNLSSGGRPGSTTGGPTPTRLFMGGGGGAGEVNNAPRGNSGGVGGGIVLLNIGRCIGTGTITTNGGAGQSGGWCAQAPYNDPNCITADGGGGGAAGGTVYIKVSTPNPSAILTINARGGGGGTCANVHGPGGGGGGGLIFYSNDAASITQNISGGAAGTNNGTDTWGAVAGTVGQSLTFTIASLPTYLQGGGAICYPELSTAVSEANSGSSLMPGAPLTYTVTVRNKAGVGNAGGVIVDVLLPAGITYQSVTATYVGGSGGGSSASVTTNQGTSTNPRFGNFVVAPGGSVILTLSAKVSCGTASQTYNASAQAYYLDPTRNINPIQRISPSPIVFGVPGSLSVSTSYESGGSVSGTNYNGSLSTTENVVVISGTPVLSSSLSPPAIQSGSSFSYIPTSSFTPGILTFSWSRTTVVGISNVAATGTNNPNEVLINTTTSTINVSYVYTINVNGCAQNTQSVIVPVNPSVLTIIAIPNPVNGGSTSTISVNLPGSVTAASTITLILTKSGTSVSNTHYDASSVPISVTIPMGQNGTSFTLSTFNTNTIGLSTTLGLSGTLANYTINGTTVTIVDITGNDPSNKVINIGSGTITESLSKVLIIGLTGTVKTFGSMTVTLVSDKIFPRNYTANDGRGSQSLSGSTSFLVVIPTNQNSVSVTILTFSDGNVGNNVFTLTGSVSATGFTINPGVFTVLDIDVGGINGTGSTTLTLSSGMVSETLSKTLSVSLPVGVNTNAPLTVTLGNSPSFPVGGYSIPSNVIIQAGQNSATFVVNTAQDGNVGNNVFSITGTVSLPNYVVSSGTLTVIDITVGGMNGTGSTTLTLSSGMVSETLSKTLSVSLPVGINTTTSLTITLGRSPAFPVGGYNIPSNVIIQAGQNSATFVVNTAQDGNVGNNVFSITGTVSQPNYVVSSGTLTVIDITLGGMDGTGSTTLTISSGTVSETLSKTLSVSLPVGVNTNTPLTVTLGNSPSFPVGGYNIPSNVVIQSGQNSATFVVNTAQDGNVGNHVFSITGTVSLPNYVVSSGTLTVIDITLGGMDGTGSTTLTISSGMVSETLSKTLSVSLPVGVNTNTPLTVTLGRSPAFPVGGYSIPSNVVIQAGQNSATFVVNTAQDGNVGNNVFSITGTVSLPNYVVSSGTLTIIDITLGGMDGTGSTTLTLSSGTVSETLSKTLSISLPVGVNTNTPLTVTLGNSPSFPVGGYNIPSSVVIQSGQNSVTFVVNTAQDGNVGNHVFSITGSVSIPNYVVSSGTLTVIDITLGGMDGTGSTTLTLSSGMVSETLSKTLSISLPVGVNTNVPLTVTLGNSPVFPVGGYSIPSNVIIQAGQNSATFVVNTAQDGNVGNNVFSITGTVSLPNYVVSSGTLTVSDITLGGMDGTGSTTLTISSGTVSETLSKTLSVSLPVGINTTTSLTITLGNSPSFPVGYSLPSSVVIQSGQNSATFVVNTAQDGNVGNNVFSITGTVSLPNYIVSSGTLTVIDITLGGISGTGSTTLTLSSGTVSETLSKTLSVSLPVGINTTTSLTITLGRSPAFPVGGYNIPSNVVIQSGQNSATFVLNTAQDGNVGNNVFSITGTVSLPNYIVSSGTLTVIDITLGGMDGTGSTTLTLSSGTVSETLSKTLSVSLPVGINTTTSLTITLGNSPSFPVGGYNIPSSVVIQSGQNSATFVVNTAQDGNVGNNVFSITGTVSLPNYIVSSGTLTVIDITVGGMDGTGSTTLTLSSGMVSETLSKTLSVSLPVGVNTNTPLTVTLGNSPSFPVGGYNIPSSVVIQSGQNSATFVVNTAQDGNVGNNVFSITGTVSLPNYVVSSGTLTVIDITVGGMNGTGSTTLTISSGMVSETLSKTLSVSLPVGVNTNTPLTIALGNSPSFPLGGYSIPSNVIIQSGQNSATFVVNTAQDGNVGNNIFSITGTVSLPNYIVSSGTLTVSDITLGGMDGTGSTTLTISSGTVSETLSKTLSVSLPVGINTTTSLTITLGNSPSFPVGGYNIPSSVIIQSGQNSATFVVNTAQDGNVGNNVFSITGTVSLPNYVVSSGTLTVIDITLGGMDGTGSTMLTLSSGTVSETLSKTLSISLPLGVNTNTPLTIALGNSPSFPVGGYSIPSNVVIQSGQNSATFVVNTAQDGNVGNNVFSITGTVSLPNYVVSSGTLTVLDIDAGGFSGTGSTTLTISSGTVSETLSKTLSISLPVGVNTNTPLTVSLGNSPSFPVGGYSIPSNVVIQSGQNSATFVLNTAQDGNVGNHVFSIMGTVSLPNYVVSSGTLTVIDITVGGMDGTGSTTLTLSSGLVNEGSSRVLTVSLPNTINVTNTPLTLTINVDVPFLGGYTINSHSVSGSGSFTVVIPAGQHQGNYTIQTASDGFIPDNIFHLSGSVLSNYTFVPGTLTVTNSDSRRTPVLTITSSSMTVVGGTLTASVTTTALQGGGGTFTYRITGTGSGSATVDAVTGFITAYKAGTVGLIVSSSGDTNYNSSITSQVLTIGRGTPSLSLSATTQQLNVDGTLLVSAISSPARVGGISSTGIVEYSIVSGSGSATINQNGLISAVSVGTLVVQAIQSADVNYNSPIPATLTITINASSQTLMISSIDIMSVGGNIAPVVSTSATGGRGGTLIYSISNSSGMASIDPLTHLITGISGGTVLLNVSTLGDSNYGAASVSQTITIVILSISSTTNTVGEGQSATFLLSLKPTGIILPTDVTFTISGSMASSNHYQFPASVVLQRGQTSVSITCNALNDKVLYNDELLAVSCSNVYLGSVSGSISITDVTSLDPQNRVITLGNGTIFQDETKQIKASLPSGVTTARAITIMLGIGSRSDFSLLSGQPVADVSVTIPINGSYGFFNVSAASSNDQPAKIILEGTSSSFRVEEGIVTVLNKKLDISMVLSKNGDGLNDCLSVSNIEKYPDNTVSIFDRRGVLVYQSDHYNNNETAFCGTSNQGKIYNLPAGIYYYIVRFIDKTKDRENTNREVFDGYFKLK